MHEWGDEKVDWKGIDDAAYYIAHTLKTWFRVPVQDYKEKYGTVRVYCSLGFWSFYGIWRPSHMWVSKWWPYRFDLWLCHQTPLLEWINKLVVPVHKYVYAHVYKRAVQKWPHLYKEIVSMADFGELLEGVVPGYVHKHFWVTADELIEHDKE